MLNVALIGCGRIGRMHADIVRANPRAHLACVHDIDRQSVATVVGDTEIEVAETPKQIFANPDIDAVIVASVTATHADYIEASVAAGKPVFCEKPIDLDIQRVVACQSAIAGSDVPVQIGFNRRFDPGHSALRDALVDGEIGRLLQLLVTSRDPVPPTLDYLYGAGGMFRDMTIHDFDLVRFMLGADEPVEVWATGGALLEEGLADMNEIDCAMTVMRTAGGRQVLINNARQSSYGYDQRVEALGSKGMLQSTNRTPHGLVRFGSTSTAAHVPYLDFFIERYSEAFTHQFEAFVDFATGTRLDVPTFEDGHKALVLAESAYRAMETGCVVRIPS